MAGYSRQSAADIIANAVIKAAPVNAEYNALRDAFALATGHKHDGSSTEGGYVPLIADSDALNKVVIDTSNNRIGFFTEVSSSAVEQLRIQDGAIVPVTDNDIDLGTSSLEFKDLYIDGVGYLDSVDIDGGSIDGVTIGGSSAGAGTFSSLVATTADINAGTIDNTVIGGTTASSGSFTTVAASSNATVAGTLGVTGNVTMGGTLAVTGTTALTGTATITSADINSGAMDNTTIGNTTAAAGTFTDLTSTGTSTHATVDINGGAIDGVTIGGSSAGAGTFTDLTASGTTTITTVDINGGAIDGATIGGSSAAAGSFTTVSTSGQATLATADINGGSIDGAVIGASSAAAITGTTITASSGFVGDLTGNITGDIDGNITGDITGNVTGNVTAGSGTSTFNNVTVNGTLDVTGTTIANVTDPSNAQDAATKNYVDTEVAALVDSAPGTLDTLNELAAALNDDPNFSTTITNSIATKLPLAGGTMSGAIAMGTNKITGLGDPVANQDAATKKYTTDTFLPLAGGTLTGAIDMGSAKITTTYTPTNNADLTTKTYVDGILGSATAAATSATAAASSATAAASSATAAASSATSAASSATSAAASFDSFDDRYLGAKSSAPSTDNDGDALQIGALYFNTTTNSMQVYGSGGFQAAGSSVNGTSDRNTYTATAGQTTFSATYDSGFVDVYLNGVKLLAGTDFTATSGTSIVLASGAAVGDIVDIVAYGTFTLSTHYTKTEADALLAAKQPYATIAVTVVNSGGNKFALDGTVQQLAQLRPSVTYRFDQSDSSNASHPLLLSTTSNGTHGGGSAFTTGVTAVGTPGSAGAYTEVKLEQDAPNTLYYYCTNHSGMGGEIDVNAKLPLSGGTLTGGLTGTTATFSGDVDIADKIVHTGDTNTSIRFPAADTVTVETGGSERMRIDSSGNVGIGVSSPDQPLQVKGVIEAQATNSTNGWMLYTNTDNTFRLNYNGSGNDEVVIDSSGNVGIGTSSPLRSLHVSGAGDTGIMLQTRDATDDKEIWEIQVGEDAGSLANLIFRTRANDGTGGSEAMRIDNTGKLGIGTSSTTQELTVDGNIQLGTSSGAGKLFLSSASGFSPKLQEDSNALAIYTNNSERLRIDNSGKLLVGKTSSDYATEGVEIRSNEVLITKAGANPLSIRNNADGGLISLNSAGTTVGSIGVKSSRPYFSNNTNCGIRLANNALVPTDETGTNETGTTDLGASDVKFKDGYFSGTVRDGDGDVRAIPQSGSDKTSSYTLTTSDVGNFIGIGSGGSITVPNSTFSTGNAISIFNNTSGDRTITLSITTAYIAGDNTDKNSVTLATRGVCTILFISGTVCVLSGNVS